MLRWISRSWTGFCGSLAANSRPEKIAMQSQINTWATVILAVSAVVLAVITGVYAVATNKIVKQNEKFLEHELQRWLNETRPYIEIRLTEWEEKNSTPVFQMQNVGHWSATKVRIGIGTPNWRLDTYGNELPWTLFGSGKNSAKFAFRGFQRQDTRMGFMVAYRDVSSIREFAERWVLEIEGETTRIYRTNAFEFEAEQEEQIGGLRDSLLKFVKEPD
ncbi:hypothetical protein MYX77_03920 [Acidobacteriia bacterium AH_259_A11_L15]|nr:hypothetical protein [Acidobacteriia bacterium AH_259_A11_L15]